jgi:hypothetical protein
VRSVAGSVRGAGLRPAPRPQLDPRLRSRRVEDYLDARLHLAALSAVAGSIHAVVAAPHFGELWLFGVFFVGLALFQLGWGAQVYRRPTPRLYRVGAAVSVGVIALWLVSRTSGLPLGPDAWRAEAIGPLDPLASAVEAMIAMLSAALLGRDLRVPVWILRPLAYALMVAGLLALVVGGAHHY